VSLETAVAAGVRLDSLRALRDVLARAMDTSDSGRDIAALANRLTDVLSQIEEAEKLSAPVKGTPLDELRARRRGRGSEAGGGARSTGS
jgi:hypothetical protein